MNFGSDQKRTPLVNVTPLVDALFLLLIFFMVSSTFRDIPGIPLDLPKADTGEANRTAGVEVQIDREGLIRLEGKIVPSDRLASRLAKALDESDTRDLLLRADQGVPYGRVVRVMDLARTLRVGRLIVATEPGTHPEGMGGEGSIGAQKRDDETEPGTHSAGMGGEGSRGDSEQ